MKKKFWLILLAIASALCLAFAIAACGGGNGENSGSGEGEGKHTHSFTWVYNDDATCIEDGTETQHCSCGETGETRTKTGTKLGHDIQPLPAKEATCSESGYSAHNGCTRCGYAEETIEYTDALHVKYELNEDGDAYIVTGLDDACSDTQILIPNFYKGLPVTSIGYKAFYDCTELKSVAIPEGVTSIGDSAFAYCKFTGIDIPDSVTSIGKNAFDRCTRLTYITIPNSVTLIEEGAFDRCTSLTSITIPDSVTSIGSYAFAYCDGLTSITIPDSVTLIGEGAFGCSGLEHITVEKGNTAYRSVKDCLIEISTETLISGCKNSVIPDDVTSIGSCAFYNCTSLTSITIPEGVTSIGEGAFAFCCSLENIIIPDSVTLIGDFAFWCCESLESITIPNGVTSIGSTAFRSCTSLTSITIPDSVTSIGDYAFDGCTRLKSITIPDSVTSIGDYAFYLCEWLKKVYYGGTKAEWKNISISSYGNSYLTSATRYYFTEDAPTAEEWAEWNYWWHYDEETGEVVEWVKPQA